MKKLLLLGVVVALVCALVAVPVFAAKGPNPANDNPNNLYLYEKNPDTWAIVWGGAWGKYNYKLSGTGAATTVSGPFNGHGLTPGTEYSLIYYPEVAPNPWPAGGVPVVLIGSGVVNNGGDVHIAGSAIIGVPDTQPAVGDYIGQTGDKIWLVLSNDLSTDGSGITTMIGWNPGEYLFEQKLINKGP